MERGRAAGILLVVATVLSVAVVASSGPVSGRATAAPVAPPPAVGDCLLQPPDPVVQLGDDGLPESSLVFGTCSGAHYGEVYAVVMGTGDHSQDQQCAGPDDYLGGRSVPATEIWRQTLAIDSHVSGPTTRQRAAGQRWTACVLSTQRDPSGQPQQYSGTVRNSYLTATVSGVFAICTTGLDPSVEAVGSCALPHRSEVFAHTTIGKVAVTQDGLNASCQSFVASRTGLTDVTVGGELDVRAVAFRWDDTGHTIRGLGPIPYSGSEQALCTASTSGNRSLSATLLGIGQTPLPWG